MKNRGSILIVDDEANARTALAELLRDEGYVVETAADGFKALPKLEEVNPELVLTDLKMPGMSGWEVVKVIRTRWPHLPTGVITGTPELLAEQREPVDVVIRKPVRLDGLREALGLLRRGPGEAR